jgi:hypothetical protein
MARKTPGVVPPRWTIKSVAVQVRDGPERVWQAYRLLLAAPRAESNGRRLNGSREKHT